MEMWASRRPTSVITPLPVTISTATSNTAHTQRSSNGHSLAAEEKEVQPQPGENQHDDGDGEAEDEPCAKVDHLCVWITAGKTVGNSSFKPHSSVVFISF